MKKKFLFAFLILLFVVPFVISNNQDSIEVHASVSNSQLCTFLENNYSKGTLIVSPPTSSSPNFIGTFSQPSNSCTSLNSSIVNSSNLIVSNLLYTRTLSSHSTVTTYNFYLKSLSPSSTSSTSTTHPYSVQKACVGSGIGVGASRNCQTCVRQGINSGYNYIYTDFGCINTSISGVINFVYRLFLVIAFMIALAVIIFAGYLIMVSGGDPDQLNRGKSLLTKAIIGLLVIVFAYVMLTTIGTIFGIKFLA